MTFSPSVTPSRRDVRIARSISITFPSLCRQVGLDTVISMYGENSFQLHSLADHFYGTVRHISFRDSNK